MRVRTSKPQSSKDSSSIVNTAASYAAQIEDTIPSIKSGFHLIESSIKKEFRAENYHSPTIIDIVTAPMTDSHKATNRNDSMRRIFMRKSPSENLIKIHSSSTSLASPVIMDVENRPATTRT